MKHSWKWIFHQWEKRAGWYCLSSKRSISQTAQLWITSTKVPKALNNLITKTLHVVTLLKPLHQNSQLSQAGSGITCRVGGIKDKNIVLDKAWNAACWEKMLEQARACAIWQNTDMEIACVHGKTAHAALFSAPWVHPAVWKKSGKGFKGAYLNSYIRKKALSIAVCLSHKHICQHSPLIQQQQHMQYPDWLEVPFLHLLGSLAPQFSRDSAKRY